MAMEIENSARPVWAVGLKMSGLYYEGFVDNLEDTLEAHRRCTITTYSTRTSPAMAAVPTDTDMNKENDVHLANQQVGYMNITCTCLSDLIQYYIYKLASTDCCEACSTDRETSCTFCI